MNDDTKFSPKRHCMVVQAYYPLGETRVEREAQALVDQGYEVDVICQGTAQQASFEKVDGVSIYRLKVKEYPRLEPIGQLLEYLIFFVLAFFKLTALHRWRRYHVVQLHNLPDFLVFAALVPKLTGARIILDIHDLMPEFYAARFGTGLNSLAVRLICWQEQLACRFADQIITVTELWRQTLIRRGQPADKVSVVMNVADDRIFHEGVVADKDENNGRFRLIYHGVMGRRNGLDLALRAIHQIRESAPDIYLTLHGGGGPGRQVLVDLVDELGLQAYVQFSPRLVPSTELPKLIKRADLAVVPYRDGMFAGEILPTKLMEYAALGIPAIASRTPAIAAYFDETMIEFFEPGNVEDLARAILEVYSDRKRLAQLAQGIREFNQRYNWKRVSTAYVGLVERLVSR